MTVEDTRLRDFLEPEEVDSPYWTGLGEGRLLFPRCRTCGNAWLPPRHECPRCLAAHWEWEQATGKGKLVSWVVYHVAYHSVFEERVPYNVAVVELDEGPRLITNLTNLESRATAAGATVELDIQPDGGLSLARFRLT